MNKLLKRSAKTIKPNKPAKPSGSGIAQSRRLPFWRQGTLILVP